MGFKSSLKLAFQVTFKDVAKNECNCESVRAQKLQKKKKKGYHKP